MRISDWSSDVCSSDLMDAAAARLANAVEAKEAITIFGDSDVDGATSAALLVRLLRALDVPVGAYIPDRLMEGYGPSGAAFVRIGEAGGSDERRVWTEFLSNGRSLWSPYY